jgi:hypothetical protein
MDTKIQKPELSEYRQSMENLTDNFGDDVVRLPISQGMFALIDKCHWKAVVSGAPWFCQATDGGVYARAVMYGKPVYLHQLIMRSRHVGFHNKMTLDCREQNLFVLGRKGVMQNRRGKEGTSSIYKGVFKRASEDVWCAELKDKYGKLSLGRHKTEVKAALVYDAAAEICFGNHAYQNFPDEDKTAFRAIAEKYILRRKRKKRRKALQST